MKTLRSTSIDKVHQDKYYDVEKLRKIDQEQGRRRLNWKEMDGLIAISVACQLMDDAAEALKDISKSVSAYNGIRSAVGMARRALRAIRDKTAGEQLISIANQINDCDITLSARQATEPKQMINVNRTDMQTIINQCCRGCDYTCTANREESKRCPLRYALDNVPSVKKMARSKWDDQESCPYRMFEYEV